MAFYARFMSSQCLEGPGHGQISVLHTVRCRKAYAPRRARLSVLAAQADVAVTRRKSKISLLSIDVDC